MHDLRDVLIGQIVAAVERAGGLPVLIPLGLDSKPCAH